MFDFLFRKKPRYKRIYVKDPSVSYYSEAELKEIHDIAKEVFATKAAYYAPLLGVSYNKIYIRFQRSRWGSCSSLGNLNFNALLVKAPMETLEAIVVHELAHRKYMNHSKDFYNLIYSVMPDYKRRVKWLKDNGRELLIRLPRK